MCRCVPEDATCWPARRERGILRAMIRSVSGCLFLVSAAACDANGSKPASAPAAPTSAAQDPACAQYLEALCALSKQPCDPLRAIITGTKPSPALCTSAREHLTRLQRML